MRSRLIIFVFAMLAIAITTPVWQGTSTAYGEKNHPPKQGKQEKPKLQPGWAKQGEVTFEVTSAPGQGEVSQTFDGPFGPVTVVVSSDPVTAPTATSLVGGAVTAAATEYSRNCKSQYWFGVSARFTIYTSFRYNYSSVTWMSQTTHSDFAIPAYFWSGQTTWKDWAPGWKYAWANGRATLKWGVGWLATSVGNVHNNVMVDAWGNCTARQTFKWL